MSSVLMDNCPATIPPFPQEYRSSGLLLHITSLPSPYGIGDLGPSAFTWIDRLHDAGQGWWQALPLGPTGFSNSPYQSLSSFVGNGLLISPDLLIQEGLVWADPELFLLDKWWRPRFVAGVPPDYFNAHGLMVGMVKTIISMCSLCAGPRTEK
jgi:4-alpha-glucanotransferase